MAAPSLLEHREREVDTDPAGGLEGSEERPVATPEIEDGRRRLHLVADHPVEIVVVVPVSGSRRATFRRHGTVEVTADATARAVVETARGAGGGVR